MGGLRILGVGKGLLDAPDQIPPQIPLLGLGWICLLACREWLFDGRGPQETPLPAGRDIEFEWRVGRYDSAQTLVNGPADAGSQPEGSFDLRSQITRRYRRIFNLNGR
jgi:hypothetical protein